MSRPYEVFVSYSRKDVDRVRPWVDKMSAGGISAFFDTKSLVGGDHWQRAIVEAIQESKAVVFVASSASFASDYTPKELTIAQKFKKKILPIHLDDTPEPLEFLFPLAGLHRIDAYGRSGEEAWDDMVRSLKRMGVTWTAPAAPAAKPAPAAAALVVPLTRSSTPRPTARDILLFDDAGAAEAKIEDAHSPTTAAEATGQRLNGYWLTGGVFTCLGAACLLAFGLPGAGHSGKKTEAASSSGTPKVDAKLTSPATPAPKPEPQPAPKPAPAPVAVAVPVIPGVKAEPLNDMAERMVLEYFSAPAPGKPPRSSPTTALHYLEDTGWELASVQVQLAPPGKIKVEGEQDGGIIACTVPLRFTYEDEAITSKGSFTVIVQVKFDANHARVALVEEMPRTRDIETVEFHQKGMKARAEAFVTQAVTSGESDSGKSAEEIGDMYVDEPVYFGKVTKREDIIKDTGAYQATWPTRTHRIVEGPITVSYPDNRRVKLTVALEFGAFHRDGIRKSHGTTKSEYVIYFNEHGHPLIESLQKMEMTGSSGP